MRVALTALLVLVGYAAASRSGLRIAGYGARHPFVVGTAAALGTALYVAILDCGLYRDHLSSPYLSLIHAEFSDRLTYFMARAFLETVIYRLFAFSALVWSLRRLGAKGQWVLWVSAGAVQCFAVWTNVVAFEEATPTLLVYDGLRYIAPGVAWAWVYWRFGFTTTEVAHVGCHIFLQPLLSVLL